MPWRERAGLAGHPAAVDAGVDVEAALGLGHLERLEDHPERLASTGK
jgi:hypothetical protein